MEAVVSVANHLDSKVKAIGIKITPKELSDLAKALVNDGRGTFQAGECVVEFYLHDPEGPVPAVGEPSEPPAPTNPGCPCGNQDETQPPPSLSQKALDNVLQAISTAAVTGDANSGVLWATTLATMVKSSTEAARLSQPVAP